MDSDTTYIDDDDDKMSIISDTTLGSINSSIKFSTLCRSKGNNSPLIPDQHKAQSEIQVHYQESVQLSQDDESISSQSLLIKIPAQTLTEVESQEDSSPIETESPRNVNRTSENNETSSIKVNGCETETENIEISSIKANTVLPIRKFIKLSPFTGFDSEIYLSPTKTEKHTFRDSSDTDIDAMSPTIETLVLNNGTKEDAIYEPSKTSPSIHKDIQTLADTYLMNNSLDNLQLATVKSPNMGKKTIELLNLTTIAESVIQSSNEGVKTTCSIQNVTLETTLHHGLFKCSSENLSSQEIGSGDNLRPNTELKSPNSVHFKSEEVECPENKSVLSPVSPHTHTTNYKDVKYLSFVNDCLPSVDLEPTILPDLPYANSEPTVLSGLPSVDSDPTVMSDASSDICCLELNNAVHKKKVLTNDFMSDKSSQAEFATSQNSSGSAQANENVLSGHSGGVAKSTECANTTIVSVFQCVTSTNSAITEPTNIHDCVDHTNTKSVVSDTSSEICCFDLNKSSSCHDLQTDLHSGIGVDQSTDAKSPFPDTVKVSSIVRELPCIMSIGTKGNIEVVDNIHFSMSGLKHTDSDKIMTNVQDLKMIKSSNLSKFQGTPFGSIMETQQPAVDKGLDKLTDDCSISKSEIMTNDKDLKVIKSSIMTKFQDTRLEAMMETQPPAVDTNPSKLTDDCPITSKSEIITNVKDLKIISSSNVTKFQDTPLIRKGSGRLTDCCSVRSKSELKNGAANEILNVETPENVPSATMSPKSTDDHQSNPYQVTLHLVTDKKPNDAIDAKLKPLQVSKNNSITINKPVYPKNAKSYLDASESNSQSTIDSSSTKMKHLTDDRPHVKEEDKTQLRRSIREIKQPTRFNSQSPEFEPKRLITKNQSGAKAILQEFSDNGEAVLFENHHKKRTCYERLENEYISLLSSMKSTNCNKDILKKCSVTLKMLQPQLMQLLSETKKQSHQLKIQNVETVTKKDRSILNTKMKLLAVRQKKLQRIYKSHYQIQNDLKTSVLNFSQQIGGNSKQLDNQILSSQTTSSSNASKSKPEWSEEVPITKQLFVPDTELKIIKNVIDLTNDGNDELDIKSPIRKEPYLNAATGVFETKYTSPVNKNPTFMDDVSSISTFKQNVCNSKSNETVYGHLETPVSKMSVSVKTEQGLCPKNVKGNKDFKTLTATAIDATYGVNKVELIPVAKIVDGRCKSNLISDPKQNIKPKFTPPHRVLLAANQRVTPKTNQTHNNNLHIQNTQGPSMNNASNTILVRVEPKAPSKQVSASIITNQVLSHSGQVVSTTNTGTPNSLRTILPKHQVINQTINSRLPITNNIGTGTTTNQINAQLSMNQKTNVTFKQKAGRLTVNSRPSPLVSIQTPKNTYPVNHSGAAGATKHTANTKVNHSTGASIWSPNASVNHSRAAGATKHTSNTKVNHSTRASIWPPNASVTNVEDPIDDGILDIILKSLDNDISTEKSLMDQENIGSKDDCIGQANTQMSNVEAKYEQVANAPNRTHRSTTEISRKPDLFLNEKSKKELVQRVLKTGDINLALTQQSQQFLSQPWSPVSKTDDRSCFDQLCSPQSNIKLETFIKPNTGPKYNYNNKTDINSSLPQLTPNVRIHSPIKILTKRKTPLNSPSHSVASFASGFSSQRFLVKMRDKAVKISQAKAQREHQLAMGATTIEQHRKKKFPSLSKMINVGLLKPGKNNLSLQFENEFITGSLLKSGHIMDKHGEIFTTANKWLSTITGTQLTMKATAYKRIYYEKRPLMECKRQFDKMGLTGMFKLSDAVKPSTSIQYREADLGKEKPPATATSANSGLVTNNIGNQPIQNTAATKDVFNKSQYQTSQYVSGILYPELPNLLQGQLSGIRCPELPNQLLQGQPSNSTVHGTSTPLLGNQNTNINHSSVIYCKPAVDIQASPDFQKEIHNKILNCVNILLIDDEEILSHQELSDEFWGTPFKDVTLSRELWRDVDGW